MVNSIDAKTQAWLACKIMVKQKLDSGPFGNISVRVDDTNHFWVNPDSRTFSQLTLNDMVCIDVDGNVISGKYLPHPGAFIHREIYRLRRDVNAIVHTHSINTVMMSLLGTKIAPITQLGASIYNDQSLYDEFSGPVRTTSEGLAIATALKDKDIVIAKNHGCFAANKTIEAALWDMVICDEAAHIHLEALRLNLSLDHKLNEEELQKSKYEVRVNQCKLMWAAYLDALHINESASIDDHIKCIS